MLLLARPARLHPMVHQVLLGQHRPSMSAELLAALAQHILMMMYTVTLVKAAGLALHDRACTSSQRRTTGRQYTTGVAVAVDHSAFCIIGAAVDASEVVLTVALSHPANAQLVLQRWRVLGSQRLSALRDRLYCRSDLDMRAAGLAVPSGELRSTAAAIHAHSPWSALLDHWPAGSHA